MSDKMAPESGGTPVPSPHSPFSHESGEGLGPSPALAVWSKYGDKQHFLADGATVVQDALVGPMVESGRTLCGRNAAGWQQFEFKPEFAECSVCGHKWHPKLTGGGHR